MEKCRVCGVPISGPAGWLMRSTMSIRRNNKNPNLCNRCSELAPLGGQKTNITVLFADIRGFTRLSETLPLALVRGFLDSYFRLASGVFIRHDAIVDKLLGDGCMALFGAPIARPDHPRQAVEAAVELQKGVSQVTTGEAASTPLEVGIGINTGEALVGNVGAGHVKDWTAIGDTVNVAARLQSLARSGEILMGEAVYKHVADLYPGLESRRLQLSGRAEPVLTFSLAPSGN